MVTTPTTKRQARILELDFLKCVFILLMIVFHLVYIGNRYPVAKAFVYTFHMPGFLIISGYLLHVQKPVPQFLRYIQWIFVPYLLMESGYVVMASVLPIREHIQQLTFGLFLDKLFFCVLIKGLTNLKFFQNMPHSRAILYLIYIGQPSSSDV